MALSVFGMSMVMTEGVGHADNAKRQAWLFVFDSDTVARLFGTATVLDAVRAAGGLAAALVSKSLADRLDANFDIVLTVPDAADTEDPCLLGFDASLDTIMNWMAHENIDIVSVVNGSEYTALIASRLRQALGLASMEDESAILFRDKIAMKRAVQHHARVPVFGEFERHRYFCEQDEYFSNIVAKCGLPFIFKPTMMASSENVFKIENEAEFRKLVTVLESYPGDCEFEEFVEGTQYHCEVIYRDGKPLLSFCSKFNGSQLEMMKGKNIGTMPLPVNADIALRITQFCIDALKGYRDIQGVTHTEVIVDDTGEIFFIETANRIPGGAVVRCYKTTFGIDIFDLDQTIKSGVRTTLPKIQPGPYSFWVLVPRKEGRISLLKEPTLSSSCEVEWWVRCGEIVQACENFEHAAGLVLAENSDFASLERDFSEITNLKICT